MTKPHKLRPYGVCPRANQLLFNHKAFAGGTWAALANMPVCTPLTRADIDKLVSDGSEPDIRQLLYDNAVMSLMPPWVYNKFAAIAMEK